MQDSSIHLFEPSTGWLRTLDDTIGVEHLAWSPNDERIAYEGRGPEPDSSAAYDSRGGLRIVDAQTGEQDVLADAYRSIHGIGPVWSPDGKQLAYQRSISGEHHEVVVIAPDGRSGQSAPMAPADEVALPVERSLADGSRMTLNPWRVSWSPDGRYLLYVAWTNPTEDTEQTVLAAVPTDPGAPAQVLADMDGIGAYDFADDAMRVSFQVCAPR